MLKYADKGFWVHNYILHIRLRNKNASLLSHMSKSSKKEWWGEGGFAYETLTYAPI